jgi:UDP-glucose 4-epimerase
MKEVLVTGGAGFIGSCLTNYLIEKLNYKVVVIDDLSGGFIENINSNAKFYQVGINEMDEIEDIFKNHNFEYVYHLAAYAAEGLSHFVRHYNYQNNLIGSINLINASIKHKVSSFIFTSSIAVYGGLQSPMNETENPLPEDPYGIAKLAVERDLFTAHEMFGLNYTIFRPHNVYGIPQNIGDKYRNVIGIFMNNIMKGESLNIFGDGTQRRAFTYVEDIIPSMAKAPEIADAHNEIFNVGNDEHYSLNDLSEIVKNAMNSDAQVRHIESRNEVKVAYCSHQKFNEVFGDSSETKLEDGIAIMAKWVQARGPMQSSSFSNIEIKDNLPPLWLEK